MNEKWVLFACENYLKSNYGVGISNSNKSNINNSNCNKALRQA